MENEKGKRYVVETKYGWFSLDEGAYRDFLDGRSWLNWQPWRRAETRPARPAISEGALRLRELAEREGLLSVLGAGELPAPEAVPERIRSLPICELELTVRSSNGLMRAGADSVGKVLERMAEEGGLLGIRNLGRKSEAEIRRVVLSECCARMTDGERDLFWEEVARVRGNTAEE